MAAPSLAGGDQGLAISRTCRVRRQARAGIFRPQPRYHQSHRPAQRRGREGLRSCWSIGASGAGKSSLARAGLVPRLTAAGVVPSIDLWRVAVMRPAEARGDPFAALAARSSRWPRPICPKPSRPAAGASGVERKRLSAGRRTCRTAGACRRVGAQTDHLARSPASSRRRERQRLRPAGQGGLAAGGRPARRTVRAPISATMIVRALRQLLGASGAQRPGVGYRHAARRPVRSLSRRAESQAAQGRRRVLRPRPAGCRGLGRHRAQPAAAADLVYRDRRRDGRAARRTAAARADRPTCCRCCNSRSTGCSRRAS